MEADERRKDKEAALKWIMFRAVFRHKEPNCWPPEHDWRIKANRAVQRFRAKKEAS